MNSFAILDSYFEEENDMIQRKDVEPEHGSCARTSEIRSMENLTENIEKNDGLPSKRKLLESLDKGQDEWNECMTRSKKFSRGRLENGESMRFSTDNIEVCLTGSETLPRQFGLAKMLKTENIKNVLKVKYVNSFKALIQFTDEKSAEVLVQCKTFNENGLKCQRPMEIDRSYGVIHNIDIELSDEEIQQQISSQMAILAVKRLKRKNTFDGHWELCESVRLCFDGPSLPTHIFIYDTRVKVSPYTYPVTQCSRCWRFGHTIRMCPSVKIICPKCTKSHANCETTLFKCNNCMGRHMAMSKICPAYHRERRLRELMAEFNCSYKKALTIYVPPSPQPRDRELRNEYPSLPNTPKASTSLKSRHTDELEVHMETDSSTSYAQKVKVTPGNSKTKKEAMLDKKRNRKSMYRELDEDLIECDSEGSGKEDNVETSKLNEEKKSELKEKISWNRLFKKLKNAIFAGNMSWEEKIKGCGSILLEALVSFVMQFIADQPCCNFIKQLWITTQDSL